MSVAFHRDAHEVTVGYAPIRLQGNQQKGTGVVKLGDTLRASASRLPDQPALTFGTTRISFRDFDADVDRVAVGLLRLGVRSGDRVLVVGRTNPAFARNLYGTIRAGAIAVPANPELTGSEFDHLLRDSQAAAVLTRSAPEALRDAMGRHTDLRHVVTEDGTSGTHATQAFPAVSTEDAMAAIDEADTATGAEAAGGAHVADRIALLPYTSGTTGRPKGAMLSHANLLANHRQLDGTRIKITERDAVLGVLPLFHVYGFNMALAYPLARGASVHLVERFRALDTLHDIVEHGLTVVPAAPPVFMAWIAAATEESVDLSGVRAAVSGASALPVETWLAFHERFGLEIWQGYGLTETSPVLTTTAMSGDPVPGSVGRPLPGVELRLRDESGRPVHAGDPGEILVRGPNVFRGYWRDDAGTNAVLDADGWLHTGDVAYVEDGNLYLVDRKSDVIIVRGFNVYPREVEQALTDHPAVAEAAVVGRADDRTGERVVAFVVPADGVDAAAIDVEALAEHAAGRLAPFKRPVSIQIVEALPHLLTGKVARRRLREWDPT